MDVLIGGTNAVAVDAVAMEIMGIDPRTSPPVFLAWMQGTGPLEKNKINVVGTPDEEVAKKTVQPAIDVGGGASLKILADEACPGCKDLCTSSFPSCAGPIPLTPPGLSSTGPSKRRPTSSWAHRQPFPSTPTGRASSRATTPAACPAPVSAPTCPAALYAEVITQAVYSLFPDIEPPKYADETEETKLGKMLEEILQNR